MKYLIDSYAWIEYLDGTQKGQKVKELLIKENEIFTLVLTLTEIISQAKRKEIDVEGIYTAILNNSKIIDITSETAKSAGILHAETRKKIKDFGLVDSLLVITAKRIDAKMVTGDEHFKNFKNIIFIK